MRRPESKSILSMVPSVKNHVFLDKHDPHVCASNLHSDVIFSARIRWTFNSDRVYLRIRYEINF